MYILLLFYEVPLGIALFGFLELLAMAAIKLLLCNLGRTVQIVALHMAEYVRGSVDKISPAFAHKC